MFYLKKGENGKDLCETYSVDSICSEDGMIIIRQFKRIVRIIMSENIGWTKMWMATRRTGLNGDKNHIASEAENLKRHQKYSISN